MILNTVTVIQSSARSFITLFFILFTGCFSVPRKLNTNEFNEIQKTYKILESLESRNLILPERTYKERSNFKKLFGFNFNGKKLVNWLNVRIREFQIYDDSTYTATYFNGTINLSPDFFTLSYLDRLVILVHEGKHGDGNEYSHVPCPGDFKYLSPRNPQKSLSGLYACDNKIDGSYGYSTSFLYEIIAYGYFVDSSPVDKYNSELTRILPP